MTVGDLPIGTPWWVAVIMIIAFGRPALGSAIMSRVPGWLGAYARHRQSRTPEGRADLSLSAAWERQDREIKRLAAAYDSLSEDHSELTTRVDSLDRKLAIMTKRFFAALAHIRILRAVVLRIDPTYQLPSVPDDLEEYL
ncbi:hypothetical protein [Gordonia sihwensis]|uniref:hypothetical protein n=1 Tax=Gordonia sihwensis TaxID=173559 RepID=UPI001C92F84F|nr:hypothetical protein [Gordonia sihwensis]